jgi:hypothetical protein
MPVALPTLSLLETRVLGVLVEKQHTVPDTYPLTLLSNLGYKGTVNAGFNQNVEGHYQGDRVLRANVGGLVATRVQYLADGMTFYGTVTR